MEQLKNTYKNVIEFWKNLSKKKRKLITGGLITLVAIALLITVLLNYKEYIVLFKNMSETETLEVMQHLQKTMLSTSIRTMEPYLYQKNKKIY